MSINKENKNQKQIPFFNDLLYFFIVFFFTSFHWVEK